MMGLENYHEVVRTAWLTPCLGDPLQILAGKLHAVKLALKDLNKRNGSLISNVKQARDTLHATQHAISLDPRNQSLLFLHRSQSDSLWAALLLEENLVK